jgi:hypothetical protein
MPGKVGAGLGSRYFTQDKGLLGALLISSTFGNKNGMTKASSHFGRSKLGLICSRHRLLGCFRGCGGLEDQEDRIEEDA